ncbi:MAG: FRG domain-containing protein [Chitinophagales bacterium]|nr:FRG domain-containing protein [Chitinophagales bacterium]
MNNIITIASWRELMEIFEADTSFQNDIKRNRSNLAYRGTADARWKNETSLQRTNLPKIDIVERHLLRSLKKYAPQSSVSYESMWNWLTLGQHHGLPTRLLDWSFSMLSALHFALEDHTIFEKADAAIWSVNLVELKKTLPAAIRKKFDADGAFTFTLKTLDSFWDTLEKLTNYEGEDILIFFEPPSINERIVHQFALLSTTRNPRTITGEWLEKHPELYRKIIIPRDLKWEFRDRLDQMNITERIIYPGLDGLSKWLRRLYYYRK